MLAAVVVERHMQHKECVWKDEQIHFITYRLKATSALHFVTALDRQKEVCLADERAAGSVAREGKIN